MADFYIGQIFLFAGSFAPRGFMLCNGALLSIQQNQALFSILGTTYGGNGTTTFALPDLRGAATISTGQAPGRSSYALGQTGGAESTTLNANQLASHAHAVTATVTINASDSRADATSPNGAVPAQNTETPVYAASPDNATTMSANAATVAVTIGAVGSSLPVPTIMPFLTLNYCICVQGVYPSRN